MKRHKDTCKGRPDDEQDSNEGSIEEPPYNKMLVQREDEHDHNQEDEQETIKELGDENKPSPNDNEDRGEIHAYIKKISEIY